MAQRFYGRSGDTRFEPPLKKFDKSLWHNHNMQIRQYLRKFKKLLTFT